MLYFISFYISFNFMYASQLENFLEISSSLILFTFFVINYPQQLQWKQRKGISMHPPDDCPGIQLMTHKYLSETSSPGRPLPKLKLLLEGFPWP